MNAHTITPIARVRSPYTQKFGIPRQPQLVPAAWTDIVLEADFPPECVRGLQHFGCIWVQFLFHEAVAEGWSPTVRPPRLGGKTKMGVFATRSPHRPNHLGLSLLTLERIGSENGRVVLHCGGADLLDGTPVFDIKPYLPFVEARAGAAAGFAPAAPPCLPVIWTPQAEPPPEPVRALIEQSLAQDPRPAYHRNPDRLYAARIAGWEIRFYVRNRSVLVESAKLMPAIQKTD
ncbi:tRNA (N6-threonylcarbamoyladenosine(37)-N6)-methyltransferase TrmO [Conchiformibius kuhniae]|uniref:tRNA (N6-threonylcarbamoyladenosine(37)-N6)-methyltransferase TrmO n=1 Tax=Conchiformibius kuhniae TaxID=211502 RepID=A0A8T9MVT6_9NEIS|nr:tRNA (N6-threonylcarbamoyladenosine(37)-N6)-methyltransferase TrmO [Conchiformibius kuhniae]UOP04272.1 tRNA (N6-threonylcarbamoyladenosine(37)-N6)-methyltransferase TrmO [Conchiformibius kuhniae]